MRGQDLQSAIMAAATPKVQTAEEGIRRHLKLEGRHLCHYVQRDLYQPQEMRWSIPPGKSLWRREFEQLSEISKLILLLHQLPIK